MTMAVADAAAYATLTQNFSSFSNRFWIAENAQSVQPCELLHPYKTDYAGRVTAGSSILGIVMFDTISIVLRQAFASMTLGDHPFAKALKWEREIHVRENIKQPFLSSFFLFSCAPIWPTRATKQCTLFHAHKNPDAVPFHSLTGPLGEHGL